MGAPDVTRFLRSSWGTATSRPRRSTRTS
jgi:hypothetical protein